MVIEYLQGTPLSEILDDRDLTEPDQLELGWLVGATAAQIGSVDFDRPGFFAAKDLSVSPMPPWSASLPEFAATCMESVPDDRLDPASRARWADLCAAHAGALTAVDDQARLVHADLNPKNLLVSKGDGGWRVDAVLDWEFSFAGCPYGDAANMVRFGARYPAGFTEGFLAGFAGNQPPDRPLPPDWLYLGRVLDLFALSDLVTRAPGHEVADQAAGVIRQWLASGVPD
jgi:Ser/Thr protein kinase RdoA (MazF antagonist)